jgi:transcriptional regulator with XRE-family HTH domain
MEKSIHSQNYAVFLDLLRQMREEAGLTQSEIADRLDATQSFVSKCERGERRLDILELRAWCGALGMSLQNFTKRLDQACR